MFCGNTHYRKCCKKKNKKIYFHIYIYIILMSFFIFILIVFPIFGAKKSQKSISPAKMPSLGQFEDIQMEIMCL